MSDALDPDALLARLRSRRTAPGMIDLATLPVRARAAGLGLGASDLVRQLRGRLSGSVMPAVAPGELILAEPGNPIDAPDPEMVSSRVPAPARAGAAQSPSPVAGFADASGSTPAPAPIGLEAFGSLFPNEPALAAALPLRSTPGGFPDGGAAEGLPATAGIDSAAAMPAGVAAVPPPAMAGAAAPAAVAEVPAPPLQQPPLALRRIAPQSPGSAAAVQPGMPLSAPRGFADPIEPGAAFAPAAPAPTAPPAAAPPPPHVLPVGALAAPAPFDDLADRIARDLRRRLAVERERQGRSRWNG